MYNLSDTHCLSPRATCMPKPWYGWSRCSPVISISSRLLRRSAPRNDVRLNTPSSRAQRGDPEIDRTRLLCHAGDLSCNDMRASQQKSGFTLIELSIVIVIIGLIVGGVLVGRDLMQVAQARSVISQMQKIDVALNVFRLKYNCLPGDCDNAEDFGLGPNQNGNKQLDADITYLGLFLDMMRHYWGSGVGELQIFWVHLSNAGLIEGQYDVALGNITEVTELEDLLTGGEDLVDYFPKDALGKGYLIPSVINGRYYIATGLSGMFRNGQPLFRKLALTSPQARYIHQKVNGHLNIQIEAQAVDSFNNKNKMQPTAESFYMFGFSDASYHGMNTTMSVSGNRCAEDTGGGVYQYTEDGFCNLIWKIDY